MSWCRIIKGNSDEEANVTAYQLASLQLERREVDVPAPDGFIPLFAVPALRAEEEEMPPPEESPSPEVAVEPSMGKEEVDRLLHEAYEKGFTAGRQESDGKLGTALCALDRSLAEIAGVRGRIFRESEDEIVRLAIMISRRVIGRELSLDRRAPAHFVAEAVRELANQDEITVYLNPDDYRIVSANQHLYLSGVADNRNVTLKADENHGPGECSIDTATGFVDARIEAQLAEVSYSLAQEHVLSPKTSVVVDDVIIAGENGGDGVGSYAE